MKQHWQRIALKIDTLSLRERAIIFAMVAILLITLVNTFVLDPKFARQKQLSEQIKGQQAQIAQTQTDMQQTVRMQTDPDASSRARLTTLKQQLVQMRAALLDMQKGLVSPDKMTVLLEDILKQDGKLRLVSLKTLPVSSLNEPIPDDIKDHAEKTAGAAIVPAGSSQPATGSVYRHGVELTVQGSYPEIMNYMAALEAKPWQLFWGKAKLNVDEYPKATLTLTLFTLSLDKKWLNL